MIPQDISRLVARFLPLFALTFCIASVVLLASARSTHFTSQGRIGFIANVSYFELEPTRNLLVTRTLSDEFRSELIAAGADPQVDLFGEESYRPLAYFDLTGAGPDADSVRRSVDLGLVRLANWINDERAEFGVPESERPKTVVLRPASEPDRRSATPWALAGAAVIAGLVSIGSAVLRSPRPEGSPDEPSHKRSRLAQQHHDAVLAAGAALALLVTLDPETLLVGWWRLPDHWHAALVVSLAALVGILAYDHQALRRTFSLKSPAILLLLIPASGLILAPSAIDPVRSIGGAMVALAVGGTFVMIASVQPVDRISRALLVALIVQLVISLPVERWGPATDLSLFHAQDLGVTNLGRYRGIFASPNEMGRAALVALLLVPFAKIRYAPVELATIAVALGSLLASQSRTAIIASVVAFGVARFAARRRPVQRAAATALGAAASLYALSEAGLAERIFGSVDNGAPLWSFSGRSSIWNASLELVSTKPLFGVGFNNEPAAFAEAKRLGLIDNVVDHAHNVVLQIALIGGLVALAAFAGVLRVSWAHVRGGLSPSAWALIAAVMTLSITQSIFTARPGWFDVAVWLLLASVVTSASVGGQPQSSSPQLSGLRR